MSVSAFEEETGHEALDATIINLPPGSLLDQVEVLNYRPGGYIDCWVPQELIDHEEVPVKQEWAESLARDMRNSRSEVEEDTGQHAPILLGMIPGEPKLKIIDGFHRDAALRINGEVRRYASVREIDWDSLYDERIFTAKDHVHVRFSRVVQWVEEIWNRTELSAKISAMQAMTLFRYDLDGSKLGLTPEEVEATKAWVAKKETQWQVAAMTMYSHLKIAEMVDPQLVHATREKRGGHVLDAPTQAILKTFSEELPRRFDMQQVVMQAAMARNLKGPEVKALSQAVAQYESVEEAANFIAGINWDIWEPTYSETVERALRRAHDPRYKGASVLARSVVEVKNVQDRIELIRNRKEEVTPDMMDSLAEVRAQALSLALELGSLATDVTVLMGGRAYPKSAESMERAKIAYDKDAPHINFEFRSGNEGKFIINGRPVELGKIDDGVMRFLLATTDGELPVAMLTRFMHAQYPGVKIPIILDAVDRINRDCQIPGKGVVITTANRQTTSGSQVTLTLNPALTRRPLDEAEKARLLSVYLRANQQ